MPWEPVPGRGRIEVKTKVGVLQGISRGDSLSDLEIKDTVAKRVYITKKRIPESAISVTPSRDLLGVGSNKGRRMD